MPPRNPRPPAGPDFDRFATRVEAGQNALRERVEELFDGLAARIDRIERDAAKGEIERGRILGEVAELRRDTGELRDLTVIKGAEVKATAEAAAVEVKATAVTVATTAAQAAAHGPKGTKTWRWILGVLAGVAAFGALVDNLPKIVKFLSVMWKALEGMAK